MTNLRPTGSSTSSSSAAGKSSLAHGSASKKLSAGSEIDAWCTRCRMDLGHRIVAMVGTAPKRVICQTCGSEHNFRPAAGSALGGSTVKAAAARAGSRDRASGEGRSKTTGTKRQEQIRAEWEARLASGAPKRSYLPTERFAVGDLLQHPKFGDGYVRSLISPNKVTIAFSTGERTLIHAPEP